MEAFIDIHCHLLPQLDDGSKSVEQTISTLRIADTEGIQTIIATPHYYEGRYMASLTSMEEALYRVREKLDSVIPRMNILLGSEIYYSHQSNKLLREKKIPTMAKSRYILLEFSPMAEYRYIKNALQELIMEGYSPILAHAERYQNITKEIEVIQEFIDMGVYVQVNAMSILGETGMAYKNISKKLLKNGLVHFVATDSHCDQSRAPRLKKCAAYISKKFGEDYSNEILIRNPGKILRNEYI